MVAFEPAEGDKETTKVTWTVECEPRFYLDTVLGYYIEYLLGAYLNTVEKSGKLEKKSAAEAK